MTVPTKTKSAALEAAELRKLELEARKLELEAQYTELSLATRRRDDAEEAASNSRNRFLTVPSMTDSVNFHILSELSLRHRQSPGEAITLVINSPGGSVISGLALCDRVLELRAAGTPVHTEVRGMAASMAGVLAQVGERRTMSRSSFLLIHEAATGAIGKTSELEDTLEFIKRLQEKLLGLLTGRSNLTPTQVKRRWMRKDWWIDSNEAMSLGLIDEIL